MDRQDCICMTFKYKLLPTNEQEQTMAFVLRRCCELYNAALQERRDAWHKCHKSITRAHQSGELPRIKDVRPEYHDVNAQPLPPAGRETGIDVGLKAFLITAEGEVVENPRHYRKAEKALKMAQRRVSRRKKGSKRRRKAVQLLARKHQKVKRQRRDFHYKTALALVRHYDTIYLEDLRVANMVQNSHLAKSISDAGWAQFRTILEGKAAYAGRRVIAVPPAFTSQDCSGCGARVEKSLSVRTHMCPSCGLILDRDENAARNIQRAGQALQGAVAVATVTN